MKPERYDEVLALIANASEWPPTCLTDDLERLGFVIVDREQLWRVLRRSRQQTHEARQDAKRWREHVAAIKASGLETTLGAENPFNRADCVYFKSGRPSGDCGGDGHFMCQVCAKKVAW